MGGYDFPGSNSVSDFCFESSNQLCKIFYVTTTVETLYLHFFAKKSVIHINISGNETFLSCILLFFLYQSIDLHALTGWIPERMSIKRTDPAFNESMHFDRLMTGLRRGKCLNVRWYYCGSSLFLLS